MRRVNFIDNDEDYQCAFLGALGFSNRAIHWKTNLSNGQISYRLRKADIRRLDYRDGLSAFADITFKVVTKSVDAQLAKHLHKHLKNNGHQ